MSAGAVVCWGGPWDGRALSPGDVGRVMRLTASPRWRLADDAEPAAGAYELAADSGPPRYVWVARPSVGASP